MTAIEQSTTVQPDGRLVVQHPDLKPGEPVRVIVLRGALLGPPAQPHPPGRRLKQDWAGGLADLAKEFTSVELQHKAQEWWGD
jgi:hypothetical protein